jgi:hypothetical protein
MKWCSPSEFWQMPPGAFWWLVDAHTAKGPQGDMEEIYQMLQAAKG